MRMLILGTGSATGEWKKANVTHMPKTWKAHLCRTKRGLPKVESQKAMKTLECGILNIHHGNRVPIVVRGRESRLRAKGNSESISKQKGWCARHYEKSDSCLEKP
jgi:hypothetical protein